MPAAQPLLAAMLLCFRYLAEPMAQLPQHFGPIVIGTLVLYIVAFDATFVGQSRAALLDRLAMYRVAALGSQQPDALYD